MKKYIIVDKKSKSNSKPKKHTWLKVLGSIAGVAVIGVGAGFAGYGIAKAVEHKNNNNGNGGTTPTVGTWKQSKFASYNQDLTSMIMTKDGKMFALNSGQLATVVDGKLVNVDNIEDSVKMSELFYGQDGNIYAVSGASAYKLTKADDGKNSWTMLNGVQMGETSLLSIDKNGIIYVIDNTGKFIVNTPTTNSDKQIVYIPSNQTSIDGFAPTMMSSMSIDKDGNIIAFDGGQKVAKISVDLDNAKVVYSVIELSMGFKAATVGQDGNIYASTTILKDGDTSKQNIALFKISIDKDEKVDIQELINDWASMGYPQAMTTDSDGNIYDAISGENNQNNIYKISETK